MKTCMRAYKVVDAFSSHPFLGNPVAVVLDAEGLSSEQMQSIARWTNLSETTFVLPPVDSRADYRLRIFTPLRELPFAGHPTLGSVHAILEAGYVKTSGDVLVQECGVGLVYVRISGSGRGKVIALDMPPATLTPLAEAQIFELENILGASVIRQTVPAIVDVGAVWIVAQLSDADAVLQVTPDLARSALFENQLGATGVTIFGKHEQEDGLIEVRSFAPSCGVNEDPVCGSGNGSVAYFQLYHSMIDAAGSHYIANQGRCVSRDGKIFVEVAKGNVSIGGACVTCVDGHLQMP